MENSNQTVMISLFRVVFGEQKIRLQINVLCCSADDSNFYFICFLLILANVVIFLFIPIFRFWLYSLYLSLVYVLQFNIYYILRIGELQCMFKGSSCDFFRRLSRRIARIGCSAKPYIFRQFFGLQTIIRLGC